jgi:Ca2+-binding RTX toxin-like protein
MTFANFMNNVRMVGFDASAESMIRASLSEIYATTTGRSMLDIVTNGSIELILYFRQGSMSASQGTFPERVQGFEQYSGKYFVAFDTAFSSAYITPNGQGFAYTLTTFLAHELVHTIKGLADSDVRGSEILYASNFAGATVDFANDIHVDLSVPKRLSYVGSGSQIVAGYQYSQRTAIDAAVVGIVGTYDVNQRNVWDRTLQLEPHSVGSKDVLIGSSGNEQMKSGDGNDFLYGGGGFDVLEGGAGNDYLESGKGEIANGAQPADNVGDLLWGGANNDTIYGAKGDDFLYGEAGEDKLYGGEGKDILEGHDEKDTLEGGKGDDSLYGGTGADSLDGGDNKDYLFGEDGNDTLIGGAGDDILDGRANNDTLEGGDGNDTYILSGGNDTIDDDGSKDVIEGLRGTAVETETDSGIYELGGATITKAGGSLIINDAGGSVRLRMRADNDNNAHDTNMKICA